MVEPTGITITSGTNARSTWSTTACVSGAGGRLGDSAVTVSTAPTSGLPSFFWTCIAREAAGTVAHSNRCSRHVAVSLDNKRFVPVRGISLPSRTARIESDALLTYPNPCIRAYVMGSFRNQLLVLIIGLIVVTQSVTLI